MNDGPTTAAGAKHTSHLVAEGDQPSADGLANSLGQTSRFAPIGEISYQLAEEEGIAVGLLAQHPGQAGGRIEVWPLHEDPGQRILVETAECETCHELFSAEIDEHVREGMHTIELGVAVGAEHQQWDGCR